LLLFRSLDLSVNQLHLFHDLRGRGPIEPGRLEAFEARDHGVSHRNNATREAAALAHVDNRALVVPLVLG